VSKIILLKVSEISDFSLSTMKPDTRLEETILDV
jgi:hypothetical protein